MKVVLDTNVLVSSILGANGASRAVLRLAFEGEIQPLVGNALFSEYEAVLRRNDIFARSPFDLEKRSAFLDDVLSVCKWVEIHFIWRPNLRDEGDNHVVELALAGNADYLITHNIRDMMGGDLLLPDLRVVEPGEFLNMRKDKSWQH